MTARDALIAAGENLDAALTAYRGCSPANRSARLRELETAHDRFASALARACDPDQAANPADDLLHLGREVERASIYAVNGGRLSRVPITWPSLLGGTAARWVQAGCPAERLVYLDTLVLRVRDRAWADANGEPDQRPARLINLIRATARSLGIAEDAPSALSPEKEGA